MHPTTTKHQRVAYYSLEFIFVLQILYIVKQRAWAAWCPTLILSSYLLGVKFYSKGLIVISNKYSLFGLMSDLMHTLTKMQVYVSLLRKRWLLRLEVIVSQRLENPKPFR
jgi:hypothetical protein